jgi:thioester reductase-like protein
VTDRQDVLRRALAELRASREPIALVGIGCRLPGGVEGPEAFRALLRDGCDAITEVPASRWSLDELYDPDPDAPGKTYTRHGGFIDDVEGFDARFFGIPPREAASMDPAQRVVLEVAWSALEHAGIAPDSLRASRTGVYVGMTSTDYAHVAAKVADPSRIDAYLSTGNAPNFAAGRLSYVLGLQGPSMVLDTACSSSLVTVHLACAALRAGECDLAIAGGVNLTLLPETTVALAKARMLSPGGRCRTFDGAADGYVRGEGCGLVALKRLSDAEAAGDEIVALVRGSAVNQDGRSSGVTVPYGPAQEAVVRRALEVAGAAPHEVAYVEAHGTGTPLGDPIELRALGRVLGAREEPALIGSVKTNIGHLEAAAGVAGLIKAALAVEQGEVPAHLHLREPNPHVEWDDLPLRVATEATPLPEGPHVVGVSSFGISGTNAHVVLEAPPAREREAPGSPTPRRAGAYEAAPPSATPRRADEREAAPLSAAPSRPVVVKLSARGDDALAASAERLAAHVEAAAVDLPSLARAACVGRADLPDRAVVVASDTAQLAARLRAVAAGAQSAGAWRGRAPAGARPRIAFLVPGQGSRFGGALARLRGESAVARALDELAEALGPLDALPLAALLEPGARSDGALTRTDVAQPALYAMAIALSAWWRAAGVRPDAVAGHSVGAYAAAAIAGALDVADGAALVAERGRLMAALPPGGGMAAVMGAPPSLDAHPELDVACRNGPQETVMAGPVAALSRLCDGLDARTRMLAVSHAFHSRLIEPALPGLERALRAVELRAPTTTFVSDTTGAVARDEVADPAFWLRHARQPVDFAATLATLAGLGCRSLVELGPATTLLALARRHPATADATLLPSSEPEASLGRAWASGTPVDWAAASPPAARRPRLPTYPFQHTRHWLDAGPARRAVAVAVPTTSGGLAPQRVDAPLDHDLFRTDLALDSAAVLGEHRVHGHAVVPGVAYLELLLAAAEASGLERPVVSSLTLSAPLVLGDDDRREVQVVLDPPGDGARAAHVHSRGGAGWRRHVDAMVAEGAPFAAPAGGGGPARATLDAVRARCDDVLDGERFYDEVWHPRFELGPSFRLVESVARRDGEALALLRPPAGGEGPRPALLVLDACVQALIATLPRPDTAARDDRPVALGTGHESLTVHRDVPDAPVWCWATLREGERGALTGDVTVLTEDGDPVVAVGGIRFRRIGAETLRRIAGEPPRRRSAGVLAALRAADPPQRADAVLRHLTAELAAVAGMAPEELALELDGGPITALADSLMLAELKTRIEADLEIDVPVEALFEHERLEDLAAWIAGRLDGAGGPGPAAMPVAELERRAALDPAIAPRRAARPGAPRAILLTGATGFLGAFLLDELLARTDADVHCLVRAGTAAEGLARVRANLDRYGLHPAGVAQRVVPLAGDLTRPALGLTPAQLAPIDAILHCGAEVKWTYPYAALAPANVGGTREVLRIAASADTPIPVHFVSTVGVFASAGAGDETVDEDRDLATAGPLAVGYAQTKWVAERMVRQAGARGLPFTVHRPAIGGDSRTGAFNAHDHVNLAIRGCVEVGCAPRSALRVQIAPVDHVARALVHLVHDPAFAGATSHLVADDALTFDELFDVVEEAGYELPRVPLAQWREEVAARDDGALRALLPFLTGSLEDASLPRFGTTRTRAALARAGIAFPPLDAQLVRTYLDGLVAGGALARPRQPLEASA